MGGAPPVGTACENAGAAKNKRRISALSEYLMATSRGDCGWQYNAAGS